MASVHEEGLEISEIYKLATDIIGKEYRKYDISFKSGNVKSFCNRYHMGREYFLCENSYLRHMRQIYLINVPEGFQNSAL